MKLEDFMKEDPLLTINNRFNLLLVYCQKRPAYLFSKSTPCDIKEINHVIKRFPFFNCTLVGKSYLIHIKKLPKRGEDDTLTYYIGKCLGYSYPMKTLIRDWNYETSVRYWLYINNKKYFIFAQILKFKSQLKSKLNDFNEVANKLGYRVEEEITRRKRNKNYLTPYDIKNINIPIQILFNLLLVYHTYRKAFFLMEWDIDIKIIKKYFPNVFKFKKIEYDSKDCYLISLDELPPVPKNAKKEAGIGYTYLDLYLGKVLHYSCPGQFINRPIYSGITYYVNKVQFLSEICWEFRDIEDKTIKFNRIAKLYGWKVSSEMNKNKRVKTMIVNKLIRNIENKDLKNKIKKLLAGEIKSFIYKGNENLDDLRGFIIKENNKISLFIE